MVKAQDNDLDSKKKNNEQQLNEGFSGENLPKDYPSKVVMKPEKEIGRDGKERIVKRAHVVEDPAADQAEQTDRNWNENESLSREVSAEDLAKKASENKEIKSDITQK